MVEPLEMPFEVWTPVVARGHVFNWGPDLHPRWRNFEGGTEAHCKA